MGIKLSNSFKNCANGTHTFTTLTVNTVQLDTLSCVGGQRNN